MAERALEERQPTDEEIAQVAYAANAAWCRAIADPVPDEWAVATDTVRNGYLEGVQTLRASPTLTPTELHERWCATRRAAGWVYGIRKDPGAAPPTHPCLIEWSKLPRAQRFKDRIFSAVVRALM